MTTQSRSLLRAVLLSLLALLPLAAVADVTLVPAGSVWKYRDNGSDQGTAWRAPGFDDSSWASGPAELGYGDGDEATVVSYGPDAANKYITTYFRLAFNVADPASLPQTLTMYTKRDDGAIVYLNGTEVWRSNMPAGTVTYQTPAASNAGDSEADYIGASIDRSLLVAGRNVFAVEIHQDSAGSSDISFDLRLDATTSEPVVTVTRGPYLQIGTPTSVHVRWRTDVTTDSVVHYGTSAASLTSTASVATPVTDHEVTLTGLTPDTKYFYSIGTSGQVVAGDASYFFTTAPTSGTAIPTRVWVLGDSGTGNADAAAVRDAYLNFTGTRATNLWLMLGDNAYEEGLDDEYQWAVFDMYPSMLRQSVLWSTIGNHDTAQATTVTSSLPYFAIFSLPTNAEAGGVASGTEKYYSFDYGNIHFICLDSMTSNRATTGPMLTWLQNDLASTSKQWIIAFWHHPPYSKGSHDSDNDSELKEMRENALPILEQYGVDLVLSGHSHSYERSFLIDSHYGLSTTFTSAMKKNGGSGRTDDSGAYTKPTLGPAAHEGAVYVVAGSSGLVQPAALNHPAMYIGLNNMGSVVLDVDGGRLDAKFLRENGTVADYFTIIKGSVAAPIGLTATATSSSSVSLAWTDNASNEDGFRVERCTGSTASCSDAQYSQIAQVNATAYADATVAANTTYSYRVRAYNASANSPYSNAAQVTTPVAPPAAPTALSASATSATSIALTWTDNASNEDGFRVERCTGTTATCTSAMYAQIAQVTAANYIDASVAESTTYAYRVRAYNSAGNSAYSNSAQATTPATIPNAPSALSATAVSATQINLAWTDNSTNEAGFRIERCAAASCTDAMYAQIAQVTVNTYADTNVAPSSTYTYRVRAYNSAGNSAYSNSAQATTPVIIPNPPTALTATAASSTRIDLQWTDNASNEDGFRIERCSGTAGACDANPTSFAQIAQLSANATAYADTTASANTHYSYRVRAFNSAGNSPYSNTASAKTPQPLGVRADFNGDRRGDILLQNSSTATIREWQMNGSTITLDATVSTPAANWKATSIGDFNGDELADLVLQTSDTGDIALWQMNGATITSGKLIASPGTQWKVATNGDFDNDGDDDLVLQNTTTGDVAVWLMDGPTITTGRVIGNPGTAWSIVATADFNGDGRDDLVLQNSSTARIDIWLMNGATVSTMATVASPLAVWKLVTAADYSGDGKADLLLQRSDTGEVAVWQMNGTTLVTGKVIAAPDPQWKAIGGADYDGDGRSDVLVRNTAGDLAVWQISATAILSGKRIASPGVAWKPVVR